MIENELNEWFKDRRLPWWGPLAKRFLQFSEIPKHVAFVMDGNRRYARRRQLGSVLQGHALGFDKMTKILDWCRELGVQEVTVYAFSIENFKRDKSEVEGLMELAETKFKQLLNEREKLFEKQICFRFFGEISLLPKKIQQLISEIENLTHDFTSGFVNVCLAYTSQNEIARAMEWIHQGVQQKFLDENDIDARLINDCLDSKHSSRVDILIRTSGEHRLSDFLLWQCSNCYIHFENILWPEMSFWHLCKAIMGYQQSIGFKLDIDQTLQRHCLESKEYSVLFDAENERDKRRKKFLAWMNHEQIKSRNKAIKVN